MPSMCVFRFVGFRSAQVLRSVPASQASKIPIFHAFGRACTIRDSSAPGGMKTRSEPDMDYCSTDSEWDVKGKRLKRDLLISTPAIVWPCFTHAARKANSGAQALSNKSSTNSSRCRRINATQVQKYRMPRQDRPRIDLMTSASFSSASSRSSIERQAMKRSGRTRMQPSSSISLLRSLWKSVSQTVTLSYRLVWTYQSR